MSRSYRKPWTVDGYGTKRKKLAKRLANKRVRRTPDIPDGKTYRKVWDPWDICDYKFLWDPWPRIRYFFGKTVIIEPTPKWKTIRK